MKRLRATRRNVRQSDAGGARPGGETGSIALPQSTALGLHPLPLLELAAWAAASGARLPLVPPDCEQPYHIFYLLLPSLAARQALIAHLRGRGILAVFHYVPLHLSDYARKVAARPTECPVAADIADRLVRLPLFYDLSESDQSRVIAAVQAFQPLIARVRLGPR